MTTWTTALPDWEGRIVERKSMVPVKPLFPEEAEDALSVFSALRMVDADGSPTMGEACEPWVIDLVEALFGCYDRKRKRRLITNYFLMVSKKNGKSMIAAGVMLTALILNTRQAGEFIILAPTKEAADNAYKPIREMILADDELNDRFHEQQHIKTVTCRLTRATLKVVAADSATVTGKKAIGVFIDELHEFGKNSKAAAMLTEATGGITSRPEGFVFYCTTQSAEPPAGVFLDKLSYARKVRDGKVKDPRFLPIIYEFPDHMLKSKAYEDLDNAYITNPNWGISVDAEVIEQKLLEATEAGEHAVRDVRAKHLNIEIGLNLRSDRWGGADFWEAAGDQAITLETLLERSEVAVVGIDGGGLDDLLGLAVLGRERETGKWLLWCHAWAHEIALERRKEIAPRLLDFQRQGDLTIVARPGADVMAVADLVCQVRDSGLLPDEKGIAVDASGIGAIVDELITEDRGIDFKQIVAISQGYKLNGAIKDTERKVAGRELLHAGRPMMAWCVGNARIEDKGNAILITKQASGKAKIDPLMAAFCAVSLMALNPAGAAAPEIHVLDF
jgi:phage terminase large subunit-like protein